MWRVRVLLFLNAPTAADLPSDSGLLGGGLQGGITSAVGRTAETAEYPPPPPPPPPPLGWWWFIIISEKKFNPSAYSSTGWSWTCELFTALPI
ncbi:hypothetical protein Hanom_Chr06g00578401 [Helianthus anomalus]